MARGNLTAMMVCLKYGFELDGSANPSRTGEFVFGQCTSTDNTTFNTENSFEEARGYQQNENYITLSELLENKWIYVGAFTYYNNYNVINFYKISDQ